MQPRRRSHRRSSLDRAEAFPLPRKKRQGWGSLFSNDHRLGLRAQGGPFVDGGRNERAAIMAVSKQYRGEGQRDAKGGL